MPIRLDKVFLPGKNNYQERTHELTRVRSFLLWHISMHSLSPSLVGLPQKLKTAALLFTLSSAVKPIAPRVLQVWSDCLGPRK
jgi:hypothetical protein